MKSSPKKMWEETVLSWALGHRTLIRDSFWVVKGQSFSA